MHSGPDSKPNIGKHEQCFGLIGFNILDPTKKALHLERWISKPSLHIPRFEPYSTTAISCKKTQQFMRNSASSSAGGGNTATKTKTVCCSKAGIKRGPWAPEEDELLSNYIKTEGPGRWRTLPKRAGLSRCGKSCRLRWMNYLRPSIKRGQIAPDEEDLILRLHRLLGNRWSLIAGRIPGRTDNEIKNHWNSHLSKKLISQGIDPRTHKPLKNDRPAGDNQHLLKASSSEADQQASPRSDHIPSGLEETNGSKPSHFRGNKGDEYFQNASVDQYFHSDNANHGYTSVLDCDTEMEVRYSQLLNGEEDGDIDQSYSEDAVSSFLNSLINEPFH